MAGPMDLTLKVWRQSSADDGRIETYPAKGVSPDMSFLEMLDQVNETLMEAGEEPIAFEHDCREGICGACSLMINGVPHGPQAQTTTCQLYMRHFQDGDTVWVEPFRARAFPVLKDLVVDRNSLDRIQMAGGFVSVNTGSAPDANAQPVHKDEADAAMSAAECIQCGACVAACKNASAMLFVAARVSQFSLLPQGKVERNDRALKMAAAMDAEGFGNCSNYSECEAACPKGISVSYISRFYREYVRGRLSTRV